MKITVRNKVKTTTTYEVIFASVVGGVYIGAFMGAGIGILAAIAIFAGVYPVAMKERTSEANRLISNRISDENLRHLMRSGKGKITVRTELKNIHTHLTPLGRLVFGDKLKKYTTYYIEIDD